MPNTYLPDKDHVVRYVPWARLRKDEHDNVLGVLGAAFKLRDTETYLSATWAEFFPGSRGDCIATAIKTIRKSRIEVRPRSGFAVANVKRVRGGGTKSGSSTNPNKITKLMRLSVDGRATMIRFSNCLQR